MSLESAANEAADKRYPELALAPENERLAEAYAEGFIAGVSRITPEQVAEMLREHVIWGASAQDPEYFRRWCKCGHLWKYRYDERPEVLPQVRQHQAEVISALYRGEDGENDE